MGKPFMLSTPMTTLNNRLQLALLNRKKGQNALEKGFTLVELMIVIVIVGILSAVALPNFLGQTKKARATEAQSAMSAAFKNAQQLYLEDPSTIATTLFTSGGAQTGTAVTTATADNCSTDLGITSTSSAIANYACAYDSGTTTLTVQITMANSEGTVDGKVNLSTGAVTKPTFNE